MPIQVAVNGYGTIGKRVADAVRLQPDMELLGVAKTSPNHEAELAAEKGYPLYAAVEDRIHLFGEAGIDLAGEVDELVAAADVVVDACPSGIGAENRSLYEAHDTPALYQGGEDADVVDVSFNARGNYGASVAASKLLRALNETSATSASSPPWYSAGVSWASYIERFSAPTPDGQASTTTSAAATSSATSPARSMPASSNRWMRSSTAAYSG